MNFDSIGLSVPQILLPREDIDLNKWAVVACDQYTSEPEYWNSVSDYVGETASTLNMILPEIYLGSDEEPDKIKSIHQSMKDYLDQDVLVNHGPGFVLLDRKTAHQPSRKGLVVALDLEKYDYRPNSGSLIRATEGTILSRLPPRIRVRKDAVIESPHIMVLIDDPDQTVIEPLFNEDLPEIYNFDLMKESGRLVGYKIDKPELIQQIANRLERLSEPEQFSSRYSVGDRPPLLYAMGDGNHSLATAKAIWEELKQQDDIDMDHPARYALVELVNLHDPGLDFEAIHRVLFDVNPDNLIEVMEAHFEKTGSSTTWIPTASFSEAASAADQSSSSQQRFAYICSDKVGYFEVSNPTLTLETATLQAFLDEYIENNRSVEIDYVHGQNVVERLGKESNNAGFYLPAMSKHELFRTIILDGALPRKTFSMGEADEKRFYVECRSII